MQIGHNRKMTGAQCLADMLKGYGVTHVFHVPAVLRTTYAEMERRTDIKRLHVHGEKAAAYMADGYARASGKPGICMAQVIGALNLAAGLRDAWLAHSPVIAMTGGREPKNEIPQGLSGGRRRAGVRAGDQVQRHRRRRGAVSRHGAPGVPHGGDRLSRARASAIPRQRGPDRRRGGRHGAAVRAAIRARAGVPAGAGRSQRARGAEDPAGCRAAGHRRRRRRARVRRGARTRCARRGVANSGRHFAQRQGFDSRQSSAVGRRAPAPIRARAPTASSTRPTWSASSAPRPAA